MTPTATPSASGPIKDSERADVLDALRGFALLGILISHIPDFSGHAFMTPMQQAALDRFGLDGPAALVQDFLIRGKFYSLFSLLFGIGFSIQLESAARRGADFARHFRRRLSVLLVIGLAHAALWYGDILKDYALIGFVLILTRRWSVKGLAWATAAAFVLRLAWPFAVLAIASGLSAASSDADPGGSFGAQSRAFAGADPAAVFLANLQLVKIKALQLMYEGRAISILAMFLLGALVGRLRLYRDLASHRGLFAALFWICAPIGLIGNLVLTPLHAATPAFPPTPQWVAESCLYAIAVPALAVAYASGFAWLWASGRGAIPRLFAPVGRMALTAYVSQTLIGMGLFYGLGLGLAGRIGLLEGTGLASAIFVSQSLIARLWLRAFQFGPVEWLWRRATYDGPIPILRRNPRA